MTNYENIVDAAQSSCPLVVFRTPDLAMFQHQLVTAHHKAYDDSKDGTNEICMVTWTAADGIRDPSHKQEDIPASKLFQPSLAAGSTEAARNKAANFVGEYAVQDLLKMVEGVAAAAAKEKKTVVYHKDGKTPKPLVVVLYDAHRLYGGAVTAAAVSRLRSAVMIARVAKATVVLVGDTSWQIPNEVDSLAIVYNDVLPDEARIHELVRTITIDVGGKRVAPFRGDPGRQIAERLLGLSPFVAETVASQAISRKRRSGEKVEVDAEMLRFCWDTKIERVNKKGFIKVYDPAKLPSFEDLVGMEGLKGFCTELLGGEDTPDDPARGVVLLGPAGVGKSTFAKALGGQLQLPVAALKIPRILDSNFGGTEKNWEEFVQLDEKLGRYILFVDELERVTPSGSDRTSDVSRRLLGLMLTWAEERNSRAFILGSSNDVSKLDAAFTRSGRFDAMFMVDLPTPPARAAIWQHHIARRDLVKLGLAGGAPQEGDDFDKDWTGAEIRGCCRHARRMRKPIAEVRRYTVPVARRYREAVANNRKWAHENAISAETGQLYLNPEHAAEVRPNPTQQVRGQKAGLN